MVLDELQILLPEMFRGVFSFYPMLLLAATAVALVAVGLMRGMRVYLAFRDESDDQKGGEDVIRLLLAVQLLCVFSIAASVFSYLYPFIRPGHIGWDTGVLMGIAAILLVILAGPVLLSIADRGLFMLGRVVPLFISLFRRRIYQPGCAVVQTVQKHSRVPGPRAREIHPERHGDYIDYVVDKFRRVVAVESDLVTLATRRGKLIKVKADNPLLRKAGLIERIRYHDKFPA